MDKLVSDAVRRFRTLFVEMLEAAEDDPGCVANATRKWPL